jgi:hypothetical protein
VKKYPAKTPLTKKGQRLTVSGLFKGWGYVLTGATEKRDVPLETKKTRPNNG